LKIIYLASDAFGGRGGIALYNRHFISALSSYSSTEHITVLPRSISYELEKIPNNVEYVTGSSNGKLSFIFQCLKLVFSRNNYDLAVIGHLHLLPLGWLFKLRFSCSTLSLIYGVEAWTPTDHWLSNLLIPKLDFIVSIRKFTSSRLKEWASVDKTQFEYIPNCIDPKNFGVKSKRPDLVEKFGLGGQVVVATAGRLDPIDYDKRKGFDEIIEILPRLRQKIPNIMYLIIGDGDDQLRLENKAKDLGVSELVRFSGYVSENEKADFFRLADIFAMPGSNPIFDRYPFRFVFLEALACGIPVVGCDLTDEDEKNDEDASALIIQVNPLDGDDIVAGILRGYEQIDQGINVYLPNYYYDSFEQRVHRLLVGVKG